MGLLLPREKQPLAIGRPGDGGRRRAWRRALGEAPRAGSQALGFAAIRRKKPNVGRQRGFRGEEIVVSDLESVVMLFNFLFVRRLVRGYVCDLLSVGPPGKLLDATWGFGDFPGFATRHRQNKNLRPRVFPGSIGGDKRQPVAAGRSPRSCSRLGRETATTMDLPSGEICGSATETILE